jgi:hypothetical protein
VIVLAETALISRRTDSRSYAGFCGVWMKMTMTRIMFGLHLMEVIITITVEKPRPIPERRTTKMVL